MENQGSTKPTGPSSCLRIYYATQLELGKRPSHVDFVQVAEKPSQLNDNEYWITATEDDAFRVDGSHKSFNLSKSSLSRWLMAWSGCIARPTTSTTKLHRAIKRFAATIVDAKLVNTGKHQALTTFLGREETRELERAWRSPQMLPRVVLGLKEFSEYETCQLMIHERGRTIAESWKCVGNSDLNFSKTDAKNFTKIFNLVRKSKSKLFDQSTAMLDDIQVVGNFLAREFSFKNHSALLFLSRNGFLPPSQEEQSAFNGLTEMVSPYLERLLAREHAGERMGQLMLLLENIPLSIELRDQSGSLMFESKANKSREESSEGNQQTYELPSGCQLTLHEEIGNNFDIDHHRRVSLLGELLNTLQHELNNPLFGLHLGALDMADESDGEVAQTFTDIATNTTRCQTIIRNFSQLYSTTKNDSLISLKSFIDEVFILTKSEIRGISKEIRFNGFENIDDFKLRLNPISLSQVLFNLIINAGQAIKADAASDMQKLRDGKITLTITNQGESIHFEICDNGPGLSSAFKANGAKPFFTTKPQGTGLGLTIIRGLLEAIGSQLEIGDNSLGRGASFSFSLKLSA